MVRIAYSSTKHLIFWGAPSAFKNVHNQKCSKFQIQKWNVERLILSSERHKLSTWGQEEKSTAVHDAAFVHHTFTYYSTMCWGIQMRPQRTKHMQVCSGSVSKGKALKSMRQKQKRHLWFIRVFVLFFSSPLSHISFPVKTCCHLHQRREAGNTHIFFPSAFPDLLFIYLFFLETRVIQDIWYSTLTRTDKRHVISIDMAAIIASYFLFFYLNGRLHTTAPPTRHVSTWWHVEELTGVRLPLRMSPRFSREAAAPLRSEQNVSCPRRTGPLFFPGTRLNSLCSDVLCFFCVSILRVYLVSLLF